MKKAGIRRRRVPRKGRKMALKRAVTNKNGNTFSTAARWNAVIASTPGPGSPGPESYVYFSASALQGTSAIKYTREHAVYSKLFDQFRITGVTMRFIPKVSMTTLTDEFTTTANQVTMFSAWDQDGPLPSASAPIQTMRSCRKHDFRRKFSRTFRYTYKDNSWLDTGSDYESTQVSNWVSKGLYGNYGFYGENLPIDPGSPDNGVIGTIEVLYHVVYRGQRLVNISETEDGLIQLGNPDAPVKPQSALTVLSGFKPIDDDNELDDVVPASKVTL